MHLTPLMTPAEISAFWDRHFPQIQNSRDIEIAAISPGGAVLKLTPGVQHLRPGNTVSGPTLVTLADVTAYAALLAHVGPEPMIVTANISMNFLRRAPLVPLIATCRILKLGRKLAVVEIGIEPEAGGELVAHATATYSIPASAKGGQVT
jgi:uncharacterized protein (TIGR00369 family)